jgi:phage replication initiation protein
MNELLTDAGFHGEDSEENLILYDWLSVTSHVDSPQSVIKLLGMDNVQFTEMYGFHGYKRRLFYDGISINFDGKENMGINLEMSGQGCRVFETFGHGDWQSLFKLFTFDDKTYNITRLDIAYDDHIGLLDISKIARSTRKGWYVARSQNNDTIYSTRKKIKGISVNIGSKQSDVLIRIYDKAAERKLIDRHWIRCELQLRRERALNFILIEKPIGEAFSGVLHNYLSYVRPTGTDSNIRRWKQEQFWTDFVKSIEKISLYTKKDIEYNLSRVERYIFKQAGNSIDTYIQCVGIDYFLENLRKRETYLNIHQRALIDQYKAAIGEEVGKDEDDEAQVRADAVQTKPRE